MLGDLRLGEGPLALDLQVGRDLAVLGVPAGELVLAVGVAPLVVGRDGVALGVLGVHRVGLVVLVVLGVGGQLLVVVAARHVAGPAVGDVPGLDRDGLAGPRAGDGHVGLAHDALVRVGPAGEGVLAVDVAELVVGVVHGLGGVLAVDRVGLVLHEAGDGVGQGRAHRGARGVVELLGGQAGPGVVHVVKLIKFCRKDGVRIQISGLVHVGLGGVGVEHELGGHALLAHVPAVEGVAGVGRGLGAGDALSAEHLDALVHGRGVLGDGAVAVGGVVDLVGLGLVGHKPHCNRGTAGDVIQLPQGSIFIF